MMIILWLPSNGWRFIQRNRLSISKFLDKNLFIQNIIMSCLAACGPRVSFLPASRIMYPSEHGLEKEEGRLRQMLEHLSDVCLSISPFLALLRVSSSSPRRGREGEVQPPAPAAQAETCQGRRSSGTPPPVGWAAL